MKTEHSNNQAVPYLIYAVMSLPLLVIGTALLLYGLAFVRTNDKGAWISMPPASSFTLPIGLMLTGGIAFGWNLFQAIKVPRRLLEDNRAESKSEI